MSWSRRTLVVALLAGAILLGVGVPPAPGQPDLSEWRIEHEQSSHPIGATVELRIVNVWGEVNLRAGEGDQVLVSTASQRHLDDPRAPEVHVEELPDLLTIEVRFDDRLEVLEKTEWGQRRIDIGVSVPKGLNISIRTRKGDIEVRDLVGRADLETASGSITFKGPGGLQVRSDTGSILAQFRRSDWSKPVLIETSTGDIRAELLEGASATAEIKTRGSITTDFSIAIERLPGSNLKRGVATIGAGGQTMQLTSHSGAIRLEAVIVPEKKED